VVRGRAGEGGAHLGRDPGKMPGGGASCHFCLLGVGRGPHFNVCQSDSWECKIFLKDFVSYLSRERRNSNSQEVSKDIFYTTIFGMLISTNNLQ